MESKNEVKQFIWDRLLHLIDKHKDKTQMPGSINITWAGNCYNESMRNQVQMYYASGHILDDNQNKKPVCEFTILKNSVSACIESFSHQRWKLIVERTYYKKSLYGFESDGYDIDLRFIYIFTPEEIRDDQIKRLTRTIERCTKDLTDAKAQLEQLL